MRIDPESRTFQKIYAVVKRIPRGRVATYGQVAQLADLPGRARLVGYAMASLPRESGLPWHRVVNAAGQISTRDDEPAMELQRALLDSEGIPLSAAGKIPLERFRWLPRTQNRKPARA